MTIKKVLPLFLLTLLLTGCTTTITNLTPSQANRNANNLYPFEVTLDTTQQSLRKDSIKPYVLIGLESYPMEPTPHLNNRWEALIPIPANKDVISYRYKFDYDYNAIPQKRSGSKLSSPYQLQIVD